MTTAAVACNCVWHRGQVTIAMLPLTLGSLRDKQTNRVYHKLALFFGVTVCVQPTGARQFQQQHSHNKRDKPTTRLQLTLDNHPAAAHANLQADQQHKPPV
eukprot:m.177762 g.177762  ORF g.177762 m.177762 type:complete len:101 (-) comp17970_c0_seq4:2519-2821(-)